MIIPAFLVASMVGFHVEFSQSMYSSKCPYSTAISCTRVTGPSVYWRTSWARALSESAEIARHIDKVIVLIIFSCNGELTIRQIHYSHDYIAIGARFCYWSREHLRDALAWPTHACCDWLQASAI